MNINQIKSMWLIMPARTKKKLIFFCIICIFILASCVLLGFQFGVKYGINHCNAHYAEIMKDCFCLP